jgi:hypothetical protein
MPPLTGVAVNVTACPGQIEVALAVMLTDGVIIGCTVIVMPFDVALDGLAQAIDDVITTETTSPFANDEL